MAAHADAQPGRRAPLGDGHWGLVLVFPWTTDADVRARVRAIQVMLRGKRDGDEAPVVSGDPSPRDALLQLFPALAKGDDLKVRQTAMTVRASFLRASGS